jgi:hypothetical protein
METHNFPRFIAPAAGIDFAKEKRKQSLRALT